MSLSITERKVEGVCVLELSGQLSVLEPELRRRVLKLMDDGERHFVLDLANLTYLDSCGLGELVACLVSARNRSGELKLLRATPRSREILHVTKLDSVFDVFDNEAAAIAAAKVPRKVSA